jgi:hypothetical protein
MLLNRFLNNVWLAIGFWAILYVMDYIFTLKAARMYQEGANKHFVFPGGIELNHISKKMSPIFADSVFASFCCCSMSEVCC